jgi:hypothetical protein
VGPIEIGGPDQCTSNSSINNVFDQGFLEVLQDASSGKVYSYINPDNFANYVGYCEKNAFYFHFGAYLPFTGGAVYSLSRLCTSANGVNEFVCNVPPATVRGYQFANDDRQGGGNIWHANRAPVGKNWSTQAIYRVDSPFDSRNFRQYQESNKTSKQAPISSRVNSYIDPVAFPPVLLLDFYGQIMSGKISELMLTSISLAQPTNATQCSPRAPGTGIVNGIVAKIPADPQTSPLVEGPATKTIPTINTKPTVANPALIWLSDACQSLRTCAAGLPFQCNNASERVSRDVKNCHIKL